jgi:hypothetical protein
MVEHAAAKLEQAPSDLERLTAYFATARALCRQLAGRPAPTAPNLPDQRWLISDFVTFGSPLTHAEFLIATDRNDLEVRKAARELAQSPPFRETLDPNVLRRAQATKSMPVDDQAGHPRLISYPVANATGMWMMHHAAPFAAVRWTNVYDPATLVFFGDVIGGPVAHLFGPAVIDVDLKRLRDERQSWTFTHTKYWALDEPRRIEACRKALNLLDREI